MSSWDYEDVGEFDTVRDAEDWVRRNRIDPRDVDIKTGFSGRARVWVRRTGTDMSDAELNNSRKRGFF